MVFSLQKRGLQRLGFHILPVAGNDILALVPIAVVTLFHGQDSIAEPDVENGAHPSPRTLVIAVEAEVLEQWLADPIGRTNIFAVALPADLGAHEMHGFDGDAVE